MTEVRIDIAEDEAHFFGNALITFHDIVPPKAPIRLYLARKSTDTPYLGADGWQASPAPLEVELVSHASGKTVVRAGPDICDRVPYSLFVRVQIDGTDMFGQAFWPEIMQSPKSYTAVLGDFKSEPLIAKTVTEPEPETVPSFPETFTPPAENRQAEEVKPPQKRNRWIYPLLLVLLVAIGGAAYWQKDKIFPEPAPQPVTETEALSAKFARLKQSDTGGQELLALSEEAFQAGDRTIGQQAMEESVQRGNEAAKLRRAQWYDPRTFAADRVEAMDANRAARAYFELALSGNSEATNLLQTICEASRAGGTNYDGFLDTTYCQGSLTP